MGLSLAYASGYDCALCAAPDGSAFKDADFAALLRDNGVTWLPSPPYWPRYNGSCEATNRHNKIRTEHFAAHTFGGRWTTAALAQAQHQANELLRPQGHLQPSPAARWAARTPISDQERAQAAAQRGKEFRFTSVKKATKRPQKNNLNKFHLRGNRV